MANLPETPVWETGIYQLEETDPVQGGPNGIDNQQGKQLANRTAWLKSQVETLGTGKQPLDATLTAIAALNGVADRIAYFTGPDTVALTPLTAFIRTLLDDGDASAARSTLGAISQTQLDAAISALVNSSPATLDTLNELAAALGNDANFATTVTNALAAKAPIASPVFTGDPKAPTPAQFDNDTSIATAEFVQRALGSFSGISVLSGATALAVADVGKNIILSGATPFATTLPATAGLPNGAAISIENNANVDCTVVRSGGDVISPNSSSAISTITIPAGTQITFVKVGAIWYAFGSGAASYQSTFGASLATSGYQKLPSGLIVQWGNGTYGNSTAVTFPIAFPNSCLQVVVGPANFDNVQASYQKVCSVSGYNQTTTGFTASSATATGVNAKWIAIGY